MTMELKKSTELEEGLQLKALRSEMKRVILALPDETCAEILREYKRAAGLEKEAWENP